MPATRPLEIDYFVSPPARVYAKTPSLGGSLPAAPPFMTENPILRINGQGRGRSQRRDLWNGGMTIRQRTLVTGVIGADTHIVGNRILGMVLEKAGYKVVSLGALTLAEEFVEAAIETAADGIMVSSLYGQGELDCRGFRDLCIEAGLDDILLYVGGNLVVGKQPWPDVERRFLDMGFDRAFPPGVHTDVVTETLRADFEARERGQRLADR